MGVGSFTSTPTRNYKVVHSFVRPFLFQTFQTPFFFNADMSSTMSGFLLKLLFKSNKKFDSTSRNTEHGTRNTERGTRNLKCFPQTSNPSNFKPFKRGTRNAERRTRNALQSSHHLFNHSFFPGCEITCLNMFSCLAYEPKVKC